MNTIHRLKKYWQVNEPNWVLFFLIVNLAFYALSLLVSEGYPRSGPTDPSNESLHLLGGSQLQLVIDGQWHRIIVPCFLHGGLIHLLCNCYFLWQLGPYCQKILGARRFFILYIFTAITGNLGSLTWNYYKYSGGEFWAIPGSIGASTAMFGLLGFLILWSKRTPGADGMNRQLMTCLLINLVIGVTLPFIDNAGHVGGLLGGFAVAIAFTQRRGRQWHGFMLGRSVAAALGAATLAAVLTVPILYFGEWGQTCRVLYQIRPAVELSHGREALTSGLLIESAEEIREIRNQVGDDFPVPLEALEYRLLLDAKVEPRNMPTELVGNAAAIYYDDFLIKYLGYLTWTSNLVPHRR